MSLARDRRYRLIVTAQVPEMGDTRKQTGFLNLMGT